MSDPQSATSKASGRVRTRRRHAPLFDCLEERLQPSITGVVPPVFFIPPGLQTPNPAPVTGISINFTLTAATTFDSHSVTIDYLTNLWFDTVRFDVYRSSSTQGPMDASANYTLLGSQTVPFDGSNSLGPYSTTIPVPVQDFRPDPERPYFVIVATDLGDQDAGAQISTYFEEYTVGVVIQGFSPRIARTFIPDQSGPVVPRVYFADQSLGGDLSLLTNARVMQASDLATYVDDFHTSPAFGKVLWWRVMARSLVNDDGYSAAVAYDGHWLPWSVAARAKGENATIAAGDDLVDNYLFWLAQYFKTLPDPSDPFHDPASDVVAFHFIAHSRGADVVAEALNHMALHTSPSTSWINEGYDMVTLLDPHPANNQQGRSGYSARGPTGHASALALRAFQAIANDPALVIPANADLVEDIYEHTPAAAIPASENKNEHSLNLWGMSLAGAEDIPLTGLTYPGIGVIGHTEIPKWYQLYIVDQDVAAYL